MAFQVSSLAKERFSGLFELTEDGLAAAGARRMTATKKPGYPCRVSLADAEVGEEVLLLHYEHQDAATPFRASHAIYVRPGAARAMPASGEIPEMLRSRMLSPRAFDGEGMMVAAALRQAGLLCCARRPRLD